MDGNPRRDVLEETRTAVARVGRAVVENQAEVSTQTLGACDQFEHQDLKERRVDGFVTVREQAGPVGVAHRAANGDTGMRPGSCYAQGLTPAAIHVRRHRQEGEVDSIAEPKFGVALLASFFFSPVSVLWARAVATGSWRLRRVRLVLRQTNP